MLQGGFVRRLHLQAQIRGFAIGAPDAELLHFEAGTVFHHFVKDILHNVGINQVAFRLNDFLKLHRSFIVRDRGKTTGTPPGALFPGGTSSSRPTSPTTSVRCTPERTPASI